MKNLLLILALFVGNSFADDKKQEVSFSVGQGYGLPPQIVSKSKMKYPRKLKKDMVQGCVLIEHNLISNTYLRSAARTFFEDSRYPLVTTSARVIKSHPPGVFDSFVKKFVLKNRHDERGSAHPTRVGYYIGFGLPEEEYQEKVEDLQWETPIGKQKYLPMTDLAKLDFKFVITGVRDLYYFTVSSDDASQIPTECKTLMKATQQRKKAHLVYLENRDKVKQEKEEQEKERVALDLEQKRKDYLIELIQRCESFGFDDADDFPPCIQRETFNDKKLLLLEEQNAQMALALEQSNQRRTQEIARLNQQIKDNQIMNAIIAGLNDTSWQDRRQANEISTLRNEVWLLNSRPVPPPPR